MSNQSDWTGTATSPHRAAVLRARRTLRANEGLLWGLVLGALVLDLGLTLYGFQLGFVEQNALARWLLAEFGVAGVVGLKLGALTLALSLRQVMPRAYRGLVPLALAIPWWLGALANAVQIAALA